MTALTSNQSQETQAAAQLKHLTKNMSTRQETAKILYSASPLHLSMTDISTYTKLQLLSELHLLKQVLHPLNCKNMFCD